jgi:hypothetical protein
MTTPQPKTVPTITANPEINWVRINAILLLARAKLDLDLANFRGDARAIKHLSPAVVEAETLIAEGSDE